MKAKIEGSEDDYQDQVDLAGNIIPTLYEALGEDQSDESKKNKASTDKSSYRYSTIQTFYCTSSC